MSMIFKPDQTSYERECKLGEGLNSTVWRATRFDFSGQTRQTCALKLPKDQTAVSLLRREYEILQRVNSRHVVRVIAWESFNGEAALVLEWIDGVTLDRLAKHATLTPGQRDEITRQIDQALRDIDKVGACHGDLHPGNVMIDRDGRIVLIDFASGRTPEGLLQAAPAFVAPKILQGADFSHEADVFALKVMHTHVLSGFRDMPARTTKVSSEFKLAKDNPIARREIASIVHRLLAQSPSSGTQVLDVDTDINVVADLDVSANANANAHLIGSTNHATSLGQQLRHLARRTHAQFGNPHPHAMRAVCAIALILTLHIPVFADDPTPEPRGSVEIHVTSRKWMQIKLNGDEAGYAPVKLQGLKSGTQHLEWKTASQAGEFHFKVKAGDTLRLVENERGQLVVVPSKRAR